MTLEESRVQLRLQEVKERRDDNLLTRESYSTKNRAEIAKRIQEESTQNYYKAQEIQRLQKQKDQEEFKQKIEAEKYQLTHSLEVQRKHIKIQQNEINNFNAKQLEIKKLNKMHEKETDKKYIENSFEHKDSYELKRKIFLNEYNNFYEKFDEFQKSNFSINTSIDARARQDERKAIELQKNNEENIKQQEIDRKIAQFNAERLTKEALNRQIQDRLVASKRKIEEDRNYAYEIAERQRAHIESINQEKIKTKEKQQAYLEILKRQIDNKDTERKHKYVMSDEERKINRREIEAYRKGIPVIHSKVPGYSQSPYSLSPSPSAIRSNANLEVNLSNSALNKSFSPARQMTPVRSFAHYASNILHKY